MREQDVTSPIGSPFLPRPGAGVHPNPDSPAYRSTALRHPKEPLVVLPRALSDMSAAVFAGDDVGPLDHDLTAQHAAQPAGQRIIVSGRVLDENERPVPHTLIEVWQANAAGRYAHKTDHWDAPLDPNFSGAGRALTDAEGRYTFVTVRPGAYPWRNHHNAWRPAHIHFSLFGQAFLNRLVTQMYFPGDPLLPLDPIFNAVPEERVRSPPDCLARHVVDAAGLGARVSLRYRASRATRDADRRERVAILTPFQTVGPYLGLGLRLGLGRVPIADDRHRILVTGRLLDGAGNGIPDGVLELWHPDCRLVQRALTDDDGAFVVETMKPGATLTPDRREQAPHLVVRVLGRGILTEYITRIYFADEPAKNAGDPVLALVPESRKSTLIASLASPHAYHLDVILQGPNETVFFDA